jgi:hypothetical protein
MHGRPLSKYDNRDLWKSYDFEDYGIIGEAYLSAGEKLNYFSDTGRNWGNKNSLRDFIPGKNDMSNLGNTNDLVNVIKDGTLNNFYILSHPERWSSNIFYWGFYSGIDMTSNMGKRALKVIRE